MKVCNTQAMKLIKEYEEQKRLLIEHENECAFTMYKEGEKKITNGYDYSAMRAEIRSLDEKIRHIRVALANANVTVLVDGFHVTIGEALVMLAQLQNERMQVESLAEHRKLTRRLTQNGIIEFTECLYDIEQAKNDVKEIRSKINELQMAIDRANLTNMIDI